VVTPCPERQGRTTALVVEPVTGETLEHLLAGASEDAPLPAGAWHCSPRPYGGDRRSDRRGPPAHETGIVRRDLA
jgi:hypothetical protein